MAEDALKSITTLLDIVPKWIADLESILKASTDRQNELLSELQPADQSRRSLRKRLSKSSSLRSRPSDCDKHSTQNGNAAADPVPSQTPLLRPQLPHLTNSDALRLSQRKRKTVSACSGQQSGPSKYRFRAMVVVYYDGDTQKRFETLVRSIGTCRNNIRKGKVGIRVDSLSRTGSSSSEASSSSGGEDGTMCISKLGYKSRAKPAIGIFGKHDGTQAFDKMDACLDKGQALCERAAHQILRDGDCALELKNAKQHFVEARSFAEAELPTIRKRVDKATERQRRSEERQRIKDEAEQKRKQSGDVATTANLRPTSFVPSMSSDGKLEVDLEADDSDEDGEEFVVNTLHMGKYGMRSSRMVAH